MSKKRKGVVAAAAAFAASPQGRRMLQQAKEFAARPENQEKAKQLVQRAKARKSSRGSSASSSHVDVSRNGSNAYGAPVYGSPSGTSRP